MAELIPNTFTSFHLSPEEDRQASVLSLLQAQRLQTKLSQIAEEKVNLRLDPESQDKILDFATRNSFLQGQIDLLNLLLAESQQAQISVDTPSN